MYYMFVLQFIHRYGVVKVRNGHSSPRHLAHLPHPIRIHTHEQIGKRVKTKRKRRTLEERSLTPFDLWVL